MVSGDPQARPGIQPTPTYLPGPAAPWPAPVSDVSVPPALPPYGAPQGALEPTDLPYHQLFRAGRGKSWQWGPLIGLPLVALSMTVLAPLFAAVVLIALVMTTGGEWRTGLDAVMDMAEGKSSPLGLAWALAAIALTMPLVWAIVRVIHGLKPRWTTSVNPRMRWGFFFACFVAAGVAIFARVMVTAALPVVPDDIPDIAMVSWSDRVRDLVLITLLLTPFQAAAEEYVFRGYLTQAFGGWFSGRLGRVIAVVLPALLFGLAHGLNQSPPVFFDRFAFGLVAGIMVQLTGGLEAGIAQHVLNNWVAMGLAIAFGMLDEALTPGEASYWLIVGTVTQQGVFLGLVWWLAHLMGIRRKADGRVLAASRGLV